MDAVSRLKVLRAKKRRIAEEIERLQETIWNVCEQRRGKLEIMKRIDRRIGEARAEIERERDVCPLRAAARKAAKDLAAEIEGELEGASIIRGCVALAALTDVLDEIENKLKEILCARI